MKTIYSIDIYHPTIKTVSIFLSGNKKVAIKEFNDYVKARSYSLRKDVTIYPDKITRKVGSISGENLIMLNVNESNPKEIKFNSKGFLDWLEKRIDITTKEKNDTTELNLKIGKGGKLCAYKEVLNFIREHDIN